MLVFWILWGGAMLGTLAIQPYQLKMIRGKLQSAMENKSDKPQKKIPPIPVIVILGIVQTGLLLGLATGVGVWLGPKTGLHWYLIDHWLSGQSIPFSLGGALQLAVISGVAAALIILTLDHAFKSKMPELQQGTEIPGPVQGALAALYGGISEEVLLRLFVMTVFVYLFSWAGLQGALPFWIANLFAALLFGAGHLPAAKQLFGLNSIVVIRTILLNAVGGIVFGFLFWRFSLEIAMVAHFTADIVLHVIAFPLEKRFKRI